MKSTLSKKDLFYNKLKYDEWYIHFVANRKDSRANLIGLLVECDIIIDLARTTKKQCPIYRAEQDFTYTEQRHDRLCTLRFAKNDLLVREPDNRLWI